MKKFSGVLYIFLASASFGVMPILARLAYKHNATPFTVLFLRFFFASIILLFYILKNKIPFVITKKQFVYVTLLGVLGYSTTSLTLFLSYKYISVGLATMIMYSYPIIVTVLSFFIYKEKFTIRKILSLLLSVMGVYALIGIGKIRFNLIGIALSFASSLFYSIYVVGASNSEVKKVNTYLMTFIVSFASSLTIFIGATATGNLNFNMDFYALICILILSIVSTVVALMAFIKGVRIIGPSKASILSTLEPIVSLVLGYIILGENLSVQVLIGSSLVIFSIVMLTSNKKNQV